LFIIIIIINYLSLCLSLGLSRLGFYLTRQPDKNFSFFLKSFNFFSFLLRRSKSKGDDDDDDDEIYLFFR